MNHALLPSKAHALLPERYEAAKVALSECNRLDECKEWADQTAALASYARQSDDKELEKTAMRIRARAIRRCGELLQQFEAKSHRPKNGVLTEVHLSERNKAANEAGLSKKKKHQAMRVANVNGESFERQVESDTPPTVTNLANQGKSNGVPIYVRLGMTKQAFQAGMYFGGHLADLAARTEEFDPQDVVDGSTPKDRIEMRRNIETIQKYINKILEKL